MPARRHTRAATASSNDESRPPEKATAGGPCVTTLSMELASASSGSRRIRLRRRVDLALPPEGKPTVVSTAVSSDGIRKGVLRSRDLSY
jgi:hypothetical protein